MKVTIEKFKSVDKADMNFNSINVLVGGNNAGKSSIIHAIQFAVSCAQTLNANAHGKFKKGDKHVSTLSPEELFYSPIKNVYSLGFDNKQLTQDAAKAIRVKISDDQYDAEIEIKKGKNANLSVTIDTNQFAKQIWSNEKPFSMYVPGLAGIPFEEEYKAFGAVRRAAARGDSNNIFRNVLYQLNEKQGQWNKFIKTLQGVFPNIDISISCDLDNTAIVNATVSIDNRQTYLPIDSMGTGILQAVQICAYIYLFEPKILLLDEPDSHLHPNNQIALANILIDLTQDVSTQIVLATHSRTLIGALKASAKFFRVSEGSINEDFDEYSALLDLGAIDDIDRLKSGQYKWIVLSEDTKSESQKALKMVLEASGLDLNAYKLYPYAGTGHIDAAKLAAEFICDLNSTIKVLIHIDRDGRNQSDVQEDIDKYSNSNGRIQAFITECNDVESYFCRAEHIKAVLDMLQIDSTVNDLIHIIDNAIAGLKEESLSKMITNRNKRLRTHNNQGEVATTAMRDYEANPKEYVFGKKLRGVISSALHQKYGVNDLYVKSQYLSDSSLNEIFNE